MLELATTHFSAAQSVFSSLENGKRYRATKPEWRDGGDLRSTVRVGLDEGGYTRWITCTYAADGSFLISGIDQDAAEELKGEASFSELCDWTVKSDIRRVPAADLGRAINGLVSRYLFS